jgi:hypothetical protein
MRNVIRRVFNALAVVSLVLCVLTVIIWIDGLFKPFHLQRINTHANGWTSQSVLSRSGYLELSWEQTFLPNPSAYVFPKPGVTLSPERPGPLWRVAEYVAGTDHTGWSYSAIVYTHRQDLAPFNPNEPPATSKRIDSSLLLVPDWLLVLLLLPLPLMQLNEAMKRRTRWRSMHCVECGYDLRATPDRCPECGTIARAEAR